MTSLSERLSRERVDPPGQHATYGQGQSPRPLRPQVSGGGPRQEGEAAATGGLDLWQLKNQIQEQLVGQLNLGQDLTATPEVRHTIERLFNELANESGVLLARTERARLFEIIASDILGYGPIEPLLRDDSVTEIMVNGHDQVFVERNGLLEDTDVRFASNDHLRSIIDRIIAPLGRRCDESSPMVDARLPDGSRVNVIIPPLSLSGPVVTVRKFSRIPLTVHDLVGFGTLNLQLADFLAACVRGRLNVVVSGGTGSGKTTLLNVLSGFIPDNERIVTIEDAAELQLRQRHVVRLEKRPANIEGQGEISIRQLVINALRMRPDRIVVGESRGAEALDMLQAMNTGHDGSLTTVHSNGPRDTLYRVETMALMAGTELPLRAIREQVASALDLIIHVDRLHDGSRRVVKVSEVQGMEGDTIVLQDLFEFRQVGVDGSRIVGHHTALGIRPRFLSKLEKRRVSIPTSIFASGLPV